MKLQDTYDLLRKFERCATEAEVSVVTLAAASSLGAERYFAGSMPVFGASPTDQLKHVIGGSWPEEWAARYFSKGYLDDDPTIAHVRTSSAAMIWGKEVPASKNARKVMSEARAFGLKKGITVPQGSLDGLTIGISFAGEHMDTSNPLATTKLTTISSYAVASILRVQRNGLNERPVVLSDREKEVLYWVAEGKTGFEISIIMNRSTGTIEKHFRTLLEKLGTKNRAHAVAEALRRGIIR